MNQCVIRLALRSASVACLFFFLACKSAGTQSDNDPEGNPGAGVPQTLEAPTALVAYPGGASIALKWETHGVVSENVIFRDGVQVASLRPGATLMFPIVTGNGFIDDTAQPGHTYVYEVESVEASGLRSPRSAPLQVTFPADGAPVPQITINQTKTPSDLQRVLQDQAVPFLQVWYPKLANYLAGSSYKPTSTFAIEVEPDSSSTGSGGGVITLGEKWMREGDLSMKLNGAVLRCATLIVQNYPDGAIWLTGSIVGWTTNFMVQDRIVPSPEPWTTYRSSHLLQWLEQNYQKDFIHQFNAAAHAGTYSDAWAASQVGTGQTLEQLWETITGYPPLRNFRSLGISGKCVKDGMDGTPGSNQLVLADCADNQAQLWAAKTFVEGTVMIGRWPQRCLSVQTTAVDTKTSTSTCDVQNLEQRFVIRSNGTVEHAASGLCLEVPVSGTNGAPFELNPCTASATQQFEL